MANLETHAEVVGAVVDEEDGEDAVVDNGADKIGGALEEGLEVEGGVERVGKSGEELDLKRIDANLRRSRRGGAGAIIALEGFVRFGGLSMLVVHGFLDWFGCALSGVSHDSALRVGWSPVTASPGSARWLRWRSLRCGWLRLRAWIGHRPGSGCLRRL